MKNRIICLLLALGACIFTIQAQHPTGRNINTNRHDSHQQRSIGNCTLVVSASHDELFTVYVDGNIVNPRPQRQVILDQMDYNTHDIYVVLTYPENKINMIEYRQTNHREELTVHYDRWSKGLELIVPQSIEPSQQSMPMNPMMEVCPQEEVTQMVDMIQRESFDSTREKLALNFVQNHNLTAAHILQIATKFSFDSNKMNFLKNAYPYCIDKENYALVTNCLSFSSDKEKLLDFISKQR